MPDSETLLSELRAGVLTITLNRPKVNAFNLELVTALYGILREAGGNPQVRCILLTGAGSVFSAGQDVSEMQAAEGQSFRQHLLRTYTAKTTRRPALFSKEQRS